MKIFAHFFGQPKYINMDNSSHIKLENQLIQSINILLRQQPQIIAHERLNLLASNFADTIIKKEASLDSSDHSALFPDALRYKEINFVLPQKDIQNLTIESVVNSLISHIKEKYMPIISCGINSIGTAIRFLPTNEILVVIFLAFFIPKIPEGSFREKFANLSKSTNTALDSIFLMNLINDFRDTINLPRLALSPDAEESKVAPPNMELVASCDATISASYAVEVFQYLLLDKNFNSIISDIWSGFMLKSLPGNITLFKFWRKKEFAEYKYKLVYNPNPNHPPSLDMNKILGYANSKQRPGRKNPPSNQGQRQGKGSDAWKDFSASQNYRQTNTNNDRFNSNWKKSPRTQQTYQPQYHQQQQQQQYHQQASNATTSPRNNAWNATIEMLSQEQNQYSWKPQSPKQPIQTEQQPQQQQQQEQQSEPIQQNVPSDVQQPQQSAVKNVWHSFQPTEAYDDKNHYRNVPANMRLSHTKNVDQTKQQKKNQPNRQQRQQQNQQQQQQQNQQNQQQPEKATLPEQQQAPVQTESNDDRWRAIRNIVDSPYDDKNLIHKMPVEFRRLHVNQNEQNKQKNARRDRVQSKYSNQQQPQQQTAVEPEQEPEKETTTEPQNNSIWSVVKDNSPYDDSSDVRKLPPQLRRSHQQFDPEEKKKKADRSNREKQRNVSKPQKSPRNQEQKPVQKVEEEKSKLKVPSAWANLVIAPLQKEPFELKKSRQNSQQQQQKEDAVEINVSPSAESNQTEEVQNVQQTEENQQEQQQQEPVEQEAPQSTPVAPKVTIWASISEQLKNPPKKPEPQPQQIHAEPQIPEPEQQQQQPAEPEQPESNVNEVEQQNQEEAVNEPENVEEPVEEVKSLAPQQHVFRVWASIQSTKKYDDSNDYRKTPAELRRSHIQATPDPNNKKKNQKNQKKVTQPKQKQQPTPAENAASNEQQQKPQTEAVNEEVQQKEQEQVQTPEPEQEVEAPYEKKSSWAVLPDVPYDDKYDMRKTPPELRRSHNTQPIDKSKKDKKGKKDKDWNKKKDNKDVRRNPLIQQPEPEAPKTEEQAQPENVEEQQQKEEEQPQPEVKKSVWSVAVPDTPYDDKHHLSKIPPQFRRTHKLNEEKEKSKEANKSNKDGRRNQNKNKQQQQQQQNQNQNEVNQEKQEKKEEPPKKNLSPWASITITPYEPKPKPKSQSPRSQPQPKPQPQPQEEQPQNVTQPEPEPEKAQPQEQEQSIENEPAPTMFKKEVHQAWKSINFKNKP